MVTARQLTAGMHKDLGQFGGSASTVLPIRTLSKVEETRPDRVPPAQVAKAVLGGVEGERRDVVGVSGVTDEASSGVGVQTEHEEEGQMMRIPKCLEALVANLGARGGVHEQHDEEHEMARDATRLGVVDLEGDLLADLCK